MIKDTNKGVNDFYKKIEKHIKLNNEISTQETYELFPEINKKTISWRLYDLVQKKKLYKKGTGRYVLSPVIHNASMGYEYLSSLSKKIYDEASNYGYFFYLSGLDALQGELLHLPENYPVIINVEKNNEKDFLEILNNLGLITITEKNSRIIDVEYLKMHIDVILFHTKNKNLEIKNVAIKEKAYVDLYYAITRLGYPVSIQELNRTYENLKRNKSITNYDLKLAAKDRGITQEINWLIQFKKLPIISKRFMYYKLKEDFN